MKGTTGAFAAVAARVGTMTSPAELEIVALHGWALVLGLASWPWTARSIANPPT